MFVSGEFADAEVAVVTGDTLVELVLGEEIQELGEDGAALVHRVENRWNAVNHPQKPSAKLKSKKARTVKKDPVHAAELNLRKNLTGHY